MTTSRRPSRPIEQVFRTVLIGAVLAGGFQSYSAQQAAAEASAAAEQQHELYLQSAVRVSAAMAAWQLSVQGTGDPQARYRHEADGSSTGVVGCGTRCHELATAFAGTRSDSDGLRVESDRQRVEYFGALMSAQVAELRALTASRVRSVTLLVTAIATSVLFGWTAFSTIRRRRSRTEARVDRHLPLRVDLQQLEDEYLGPADGPVCVGLLRSAVRRLGSPELQERYIEEWAADLERIKSPVRRVLWAIGVRLLAARRLRSTVVEQPEPLQDSPAA